MSASADNGAARETFSSSFGEQRSSVSTNTNGSSTSTSTQTGQQSVRTRIIVDDFIALISNVPASVAAAAAAQGQVPPTGQPGAQSQPQMQGQGVGETAATTSQSQPLPVSSPPMPGVQGTAAGIGQARPQGLPGAISMNLLSGMAGANSNHPDPSLPCQSFHFGPQSQRSQPQTTSQQSATTTPTATTSTQSQGAAQTTTQTAAPVNPPQPQPQPQRQPQPASEQPRASRPQSQRRNLGTVHITVRRIIVC